MPKHALVWGITFVSLCSCMDVEWMDESLSRERQNRSAEQSDATRSDQQTQDGAVAVMDTSTPALDAFLTPVDAAEVSSPETQIEDSSPGDVLQADASGDAVDAKAPCDPNEAPDPTGAVFVSKNGTGVTGSAQSPLSSIKSALDLAAANSKHVIYLDVDAYDEDTLTITNNMTIRGGFRWTGNSWQRVCGNAADRRPTIRIRRSDAGPNVGVRITGGDVTLDNVIVSTADGATLDSGEGQSTYGLWASGRSTVVHLLNVHVMAGKGGNGDDAGTIPANQVQCVGTGDCLALEDGAGAAGSTGSEGQPAKPGRFTDQGFQPVPATAGATGTPGKNGQTGGNGESDTCVISCGLERCACQASKAMIAATSGTCGCGGSGGSAGGAGNTGGASVALLSTAGARLDFQQAELRAGDGGKGTKGGLGEDGSVGTSGSGGANTQCFATCNTIGACGGQQRCELAAERSLRGGSAGGSGGRGGRGGNGGAGYGGPSYALVVQSGPEPAGLETVKLTPGRGGDGGAAGMVGAATEQYRE